jgi:outer membrane usher protein
LLLFPNDVVLTAALLTQNLFSQAPAHATALATAQSLPPAQIKTLPKSKQPAPKPKVKPTVAQEQEEEQIEIKSDSNAMPAIDSEYSEVYLGVYVNGIDTRRITLFLEDKQGNLYVHKSDLDEYSLYVPKAPPIEFEGQVYYPVASFSDGEVKIDKKNLTVSLVVGADFFKSNAYTATDNEFVVPTEPDLGGFFNYDIYGLQTDGMTFANGIFTPGIFYASASATSGFLASYNEGDDENDQFTNFVRLNSSVEIDYPRTMKTLILGDAFSTTGLWGSSIGFGGIQWGTNFGTQPTFLTYPMPSFTGEATVPSAVDLYLNNALVDKQSVPPGPFTITDIPVTSGSGNLTVVVTDLLGRQETITIPYYLSTGLLKPGLHDYSLEAGFIRLNYGNESNDYGQFMTVYTDRFGVTDILTAEWRAEALLDQQTLGAGGVFLLQDWATVVAATAASHSEFGMGGLVEFGFQRTSQDAINFGFNLTTTSPDFTQIGFGENTVAPSFQGQYFAGMGLDELGTLAVNYIQQNNRGSENIGLISASYFKSLFKIWSLSLGAQAQVSGGSNNSVYLTLSRMYGTYTSLNFGGSAQKGQNPQGNAQINRALPYGPGWGYNLSTSQGDNDFYQGTVMAQSDVGTYSLGAARQIDQMSYQGGVRGSLAVVDNDVYLARTLGSSFGVVEVPGYENVRVYNYNQVVGTTNGKGKVFMPNLLSYQNNTVGIEPDDLPIGTEIQTAQMNMIPYFQSGLKITFPIDSHYGATARLVDLHGKDFPAGTLVEAVGNDNQMMVAAKGEVYLNELQIGTNEFIVKSEDKTCRFSINFVVNPEDELPDLGTLVCKD